MLGVAGICTPYMPFPNVTKHLAIVDGDVERQYVAWFQQPGVAEAHMDPRVRTPLEELLPLACAGGRLDMNPFLNPEKWPPIGQPLGPPGVIDECCRVFERTGFRGGINWYRNVDRNAAEHPDVGTRPLHVPCLMSTAEWDPALRPEFAEPMRALCSDLELHLVEKVGHWVHQEAPELVNRPLISWLRRFMR